MTLVQDRIAGARTTGAVEGLADIRRNAAIIWDRAPVPGFQHWIDALPPERLPSARVVLRPAAVLSAVQELCDIAGTPDGPHKQRLIEDIAGLAEIFADLMSATWLRLRLDVVTTNSCRKFHIDAVKARLICTYRGTGTQYGTDLGGEDPDPIITVRTGAPIMLRGTLWPQEVDARLRHRSPPIEGTGASRLLLVLDPADDPEDAF